MHYSGLPEDLTLVKFVGEGIRQVKEGTHGQT